MSAGTLVGTTALVAALLLAPGAPPPALQVLAFDDPHAAGAVTRIVVEVRNRSAHPVRPVFTVAYHSAFPVLWRATSGPVVLPSRGHAVYVLEPPTLEAAVPAGTVFVVRVNAAAGATFAVSPPLAADQVPWPPVVNPRFRHWVMDPALGHARPYGWTVEWIGRRGTASLQRGSSPIGPALVLEGANDGQPWAGVRLVQTIEDPDALAALLTGRLHLWVWVARGFAADGAGWPWNAFGLDVESPALCLALTATATPHDPDRFRVGFGAVEVTEPQIRRSRG